jgi:hypothetical protein
MTTQGYSKDTPMHRMKKAEDINIIIIIIIQVPKDELTAHFSGIFSVILCTLRDYLSTIGEFRI